MAVVNEGRVNILFCIQNLLSAEDIPMLGDKLQKNQSTRLPYSALVLRQNLDFFQQN